MKIDTTLLATDLSEIPQLTRQAEAIGFDGIWTSETAHDPLDVKLRKVLRCACFPNIHPSMYNRERWL